MTITRMAPIEPPVCLQCGSPCWRREHALQLTGEGTGAGHQTVCMSCHTPFNVERKSMTLTRMTPDEEIEFWDHFVKSIGGLTEH